MAELGPSANLSAGGLLFGAFSLTAALAWNEAAKAGIAAALPYKADTVAGLLAYAVFVTLLVVVLMRGVAKYAPRLASQDLADLKRAPAVHPGRPHGLLLGDGGRGR